jgi:hypothetical protein
MDPPPATVDAEPDIAAVRGSARVWWTISSRGRSEAFGKETVRGRNRRRAPDVSRGMTENGERFAPGETVYLLREVRAGRRIHELGTRAHVLADHGHVIVLHLDSSDAEVVTCPAGHVARAVDRVARPRVPRPTSPWLRPSVG